VSKDTVPVKPSKLKIIAELVKFEHSIFALPYAYIGAVFGAAAFLFAVPAIYPAPAPQPTPWVTLGRWPTWTALVWITLAMVGARAVAFTLNRAIDKEIDARNPRTMNRAVPSGLIKAWELWAFSILMLAIYLLAVYNLAPITHWLWPVPLALFLVYPYLKRFTWMARGVPRSRGGRRLGGSHRQRGLTGALGAGCRRHAVDHRVRHHLRHTGLRQRP
jgi:4-hydroxybenzoate polyprenyltransferase